MHQSNRVNTQIFLLSIKYIIAIMLCYFKFLDCHHRLCCHNIVQIFSVLYRLCSLPEVNCNLFFLLLYHNTINAVYIIRTPYPCFVHHSKMFFINSILLCTQSLIHLLMHPPFLSISV